MSNYRVIEVKPSYSIMIGNTIKTNETCYIKQKQIMSINRYKRRMWLNEEFVTREQYLKWRIINE